MNGVTIREYTARYEAYRFLALWYAFSSAVQSVAELAREEPGSFTWVMHGAVVLVAGAFALWVLADRRKGRTDEQQV